MTSEFKKIIDYFSNMPGIGPRQAARIVLAMIQWPENDLRLFSETIAQLKEHVGFCQQCFNLSEEDICSICLDPKRNSSQIAVVEQVTDLIAIEKTKAYQGLYHVLQGSLSPGRGPETTTFEQLRERVQRLDSELELIIATNPNTYGETTALYIEEELKSLPITITRLARGLSAGSFVEYADQLTLNNAFKNRK